MPSDFGPSQYHSTYTTTGEQDKFIIGFVERYINTRGYNKNTFSEIYNIAGITEQQSLWVMQNMST